MNKLLGLVSFAVLFVLFQSCSTVPKLCPNAEEREKITIATVNEQQCTFIKTGLDKNCSGTLDDDEASKIVFKCRELEKP